MDVAELADVVADLRAEGSDLAEVEVKRAAGGFPTSAAPTLSAFANTPGGGLLILGLDEASNFASVGVYDAAQCQAALAGVARQAVEPAVTFNSATVVFEGAQLVVANVAELATTNKPCRVRSTGKAYLRAYDGDYELSAVEEQAFLANRATPRFDEAAVEGATVADLDEALLADYVNACQASSPALARMSAPDVLFRTGVTVGAERRPSVAGLLHFGIYPQQYFPNCVIQASVAPTSQDPAGTRAADAARFDGPLPLMLDQALRWVQRNTRKRVRFLPDGHGQDEPEYPPQAVRELLSNALVHRDLGPHALAEGITLRLDATQLVLTNPGGLYGLTVDRLGQTGVTSARNGYLVRIGQNVRFGAGLRVVEALASGIPIVLTELQRAGMAPPRFHDQGIRFTVRVPNHTLLGQDDLAWLANLPADTALSDVQRHALVNMRHGAEYSNKGLREAFPMDSREARAVLAGLVEAGVAEAVGERSRRIYRLAPSLLDDDDDEPADPPQSKMRNDPRTPRVHGARAANAELLADLVAAEPRKMAAMQDATGLTARQVMYALQFLIDGGRVERVGGQGDRNTVYRLTPTAAVAPDEAAPVEEPELPFS